MKKIVWLPVVIVVLVAVWLGASWYSGRRIEAELKQQITSMNGVWAASGNANQQLQIKQISYQRGLLSSQARYALTIGALPAGQAPEIDLTLRHGPFPNGLAPKKFALHAELANTGAVKTLSDAAMNGKPPLAIDADCAYGGRCTGTGRMPAINYAPTDKFKLAFGGIQMKFNLNWHSETDYAGESSTQLLPLTINDQSFGSGDITATANAQGFNEALTWKTDRGESKLTLAMTMSRAVTSAEVKAVKPEEMASFISGLIKTASARLSLSKPMLADIGARALHLTMGTDLAAAQQQVSQQLDAALASDPRTRQFVQVQDDAIVSDWQYAAGKLTVNGQEKPELLDELTQAYQKEMLQAQRNQAAPADK